MSKYVDEIIESINNDPKEWKVCAGGIKKDNIRIFRIPILEAVFIRRAYVEINEILMPTTKRDERKLYRSIIRFLENTPMKTIING